MNKRIIYHYPAEIKNLSSASKIRPKKMLEAFQSLGYEVDVVMGNSAERARAYEDVKINIKNGLKYEFMYSESTTSPSLINDSNHIPAKPFVEFRLFRLCSKNKIPIGLFYRDIYWRFSNYRKHLPFYKYVLAIILYWYDILYYYLYVDVFFIPSLKMAKYIPLISKEKIDELPPGLDIQEGDTRIREKDCITLLYVGGFGEHYKCHLLFEAVNSNRNYKLIVCTRKAEWEKSKAEYEAYLSDNIEIVHKSGEELEELFLQCDIASIVVNPYEYWEFAVPLKLYEYVGNYKPILVTRNTNAGEIVVENKLGWTVAYSLEDIKDKLNYIQENLHELSERRECVKSYALTNQWKNRAETAERLLTKVYE